MFTEARESEIRSPLMYMRAVIVVSALWFFAEGDAAADTPDSFDLVTYTLPNGWTKKVEGSIARLTLITQADRSYCQVNVFKAAASRGAGRADFDGDWKEFVATPFGFTGTPSPQKRPAMTGWRHNSGSAKLSINGQTTFASLTAYSAGDQVVTVMTLANHKKCKALIAKFWKGIRLAPPKAGHAAAAPASTSVSKPAVAGATQGFQYSRANFDDGWVATVQPDWVLVEKGAVRVRLFYTLPYEVSRFSGTGLVEREHYWREHVARRFQTTTMAFRDDGEFVSSMKPAYVEGWGVDPEGGDKRFFAMYLTIAPNAAMITLASAPSDAAMRQAFPKANDRWSSDLVAMSRYNKFAIGARDVVGTWQSGGTQTTQWYDSITGAYAGATAAASSATFTFASNGSYRSIHNGATGAVGAMNTFQQEYKGTYKIADWSITATKRWQGRTDSFDAHFQAVRGGRLLAIDDHRGGSYVLVRVSR